MNPAGAPRALVVDDEADLAKLVAQYLTHDGFETRTVGDGLEAVAQAQAWNPDLIVLDLGLPGLDGIEACTRIRQFSDCFIIMLTARVEELDTLLGLAVGADDYMTKPFSPREIVARARVLFRRSRPQALQATTGPAEFGELSIDLKTHEARLRGCAIELTKTEFDVLALLAAHPDETLSREDIMNALWGRESGVDFVGDTRSVDVHVAHIRAKLGAQGGHFVRTVRGVGYRMGSWPEDAETLT